MNDVTRMHFDPAISPVVVGIDGSQAAIQAARWAVPEAVSREVPLRFVYVIPEVAEPAPFSAVGNDRMEVEYGETALRAASAAVAASSKLVKVETDMLKGGSAAQLSLESRYAAMVCVGSTGFSRIGEALFGSTAAEIGKMSRCPVAIIRSHEGGQRTTTASVAVAIDRSANNHEVVGYAMSEARLRHAPLLAIGAWRRDSGALSGHDLDVCVGSWRTRYPDVTVSTASVQAEFADYLAVVDRSIQLIVVGAADTDQLRWLLGPRRHLTGAHAERSVLIVRSSPETANSR